MIRLIICALTFLVLLPSARAQPNIRFGVLGLFHPREIVLQQDGPEVLSIKGGDTRFVLNGEPTHHHLLFRALDDRVNAAGISTSQWVVTARDGGPCTFQLSVPNKLRRTFRGVLTITGHQGELVAVISLDRETAVASIVAAEMPSDAPLEALKAQAIVTRSFLAAGPRHLQFDFCDTTHCQFMRSPPATTSAASRAVAATHSMILTYNDKPIAAMYSSRCGGQTRSLRDVGMVTGAAYPYYSVTCTYCRTHPQLWQSTIVSSHAPPTSGNEKQRIASARQWGWAVVPGSDFTATREGDAWKMSGRSFGHGVGMCQVGAIGMAHAGADFRAILSHYYPNTQIAR